MVGRAVSVCGAPVLSAAMAQFQLRTGVSICQFTDCAIILDIVADRYWRVGATTAALLTAVNHGTASFADEAGVDRLLALGLVVPAGRSTEPRHQLIGLPPVSRSATEGVHGNDRLLLRLTLSVAWCTFASRVLLLTRPLGQIVTALGRRRRQRPRPPTGDLITLAVAFQQHRRLVPLAMRCLPDSLAMLAFLARRGHYPHLVFGVASSPFAAHCWLQQDDLVVNDALDHAAIFKPILIA